MKVLLINGSPDGKGCIHTALTLAAEVLNKEEIETEEIQVGNKVIRGCIGCRKCRQLGKCVFDDLDNEVSPKLAAADGIVIGSPVWNGRLSCPINTVLRDTNLKDKKVTCVLYSGSGEAKKAEEQVLKAVPDAAVIHLQEPKKNREAIERLSDL